MQDATLVERLANTRVQDIVHRVLSGSTADLAISLPLFHEQLYCVMPVPLNPHTITDADLESVRSTLRIGERILLQHDSSACASPIFHTEKQKLKGELNTCKTSMHKACMWCGWIFLSRSTILTMNRSRV